MECLRFVQRGIVKLYCFIEVCVKLFPESSKSTVRSWLKLNDIASINATLQEQQYFKKENPYLSGSFGLIAHNDLLALIDFRKTPPCKRQFPYSSSHTVSSPSMSSEKKRKNNAQASSSSRSQVCLVEYENNSSDSDEHLSETTESQNISFSTPVSVKRSHASIKELRSNSPFAEDHFSIREADLLVASSATPHVEKSDDDEELELFASPPDNDEIKERSRCQLSEAETPEKLKCAMKSIRRFYFRSYNPQRESTSFSLTTIHKMIERIMCFLFFCKSHKNIVELSLSLYNDVTLVSEYVNYLSNVRKLMPNTIVAILTVAINVVKYNYRENLTYLNNAREIVAYRRLQRQLAKEARILAIRSKEGLTKKSTQQFYFAHILEVLRNLRTNFFESSGIKKARYLHDFVLLATYLRAMPGRSQEIRTLQLFVESEGYPFEHWKCLNGNFIVFHADKRVVLVQCEYKTAKSAGPTKIDITDDSDLVNYLQKYVKARPTLLLGNVHNNFFVNYRGEPFSDSAISKYLGDLFEREVSIRASTNMLRHSIVTYFKSIDESNDVNVRESLASLMKHSVRYQESVYNDMTHEEKTKKGRNLLQNTLAANVFGDEDDIVEPTDEDNAAAASDSEEVVLRPNVGDICALVDPVSTADNVHIFLCKVARYTDDREQVHLMHLKPVEGSEHLYRLTPGRVWTESTKTLIYPIDIVYNPSERVYELRSSAEDIYKYVTDH